MKTKHTGKKLIIGALVLLIVVAALVLGINSHVVKIGEEDLVFSYGKDGAIPESVAVELKDFGADCILVLGCGIIDYDTPTELLADRLDTGIALYHAGVSPKILLTGDNGTQHHNEIHVMLNYCLEKGVPPEDVFCDHAGFSTSESMIRARNIFGVKKAVVVTQTYHEYRALFLGRALGLEVKGVGADQKKYNVEAFWNLREIAARVKDYGKMLAGIETAVGGETISLIGDGSISHGE